VSVIEEFLFSATRLGSEDEAPLKVETVVSMDEDFIELSSAVTVPVVHPEVIQEEVDQLVELFRDIPIPTLIPGMSYAVLFESR